MAPRDDEQPEESPVGPGDEEDWPGDDDMMWTELPAPEEAFYMGLKKLAEMKQLLDQGAAISCEMIHNLASPEDLPDAAQLIPLDLRMIVIKLQRRCVDENTGRLDVNMLITELGVREAAQALVDAATTYFRNIYGTPDAERPQPMTVKEWKDMWAMEDGWGEEEDMEEEPQEGDEEVPFEEHPDNEDGQGGGPSGPFGPSGLGNGHGPRANHRASHRANHRARGHHSNRGEINDNNGNAPSQGPTTMRSCGGGNNHLSGNLLSGKLSNGNLPSGKSNSGCSNILGSNLPAGTINADCSNLVSFFIPTAKLNSGSKPNVNPNHFMVTQPTVGMMPQPAAANQNENVNSHAPPSPANPMFLFDNNSNANDNTNVEALVEFPSPTTSEFDSELPVFVPVGLSSSDQDQDQDQNSDCNPDPDSETEPGTESETDGVGLRDRSRSPHGGGGGGGGVAKRR